MPSLAVMRAATPSCYAPRLERAVKTGGQGKHYKCAGKLQWRGAFDGVWVCPVCEAQHAVHTIAARLSQAVAA